jgi:surfactin synthase thioesterase subunit
MEEPPLSDPRDIVAQVGEAILPYVHGVPYVLFGYSMGGDTSMMVAHYLQTKYDLPPLSLLFAATPALHKVLSSYIYIVITLFFLSTVS